MSKWSPPSRPYYNEYNEFVKDCCRCKKTFPCTERYFRKRRKDSDTLRSTCIFCGANQDRDKYKKNKKVINKRNIDWYYKHQATEKVNRKIRRLAKILGR